MEEYYIMIWTIAIIIIILVIVIKFRKSNYNVKYNNITFFEGELGSGKTTCITRLAITERRRRIIHNFLSKPITILGNIILFLCPVIHLIYIPLCLIRHKIVFKVKKRGTEIYSNFPIWINKKVGFSIAVNKDILTWLYKVNEDCIIVLDEVGYLFPNEMQKTDPLYVFCLTWLRHGTNCLMFCASQSLNECNKAFRNKVNKCYHLINLSKCFIPLFSKVQIQQSIISEDITTITTDKIEDRNSNWWRFKHPTRHFESRYGKKYYSLERADLIKLAVNYQATFEKMGIKNGERWKTYYYEFS